MKILLVEDAPRLRETLLRALGRMGHAVDVAETMQEARVLLSESVVSVEYDVIVLDRMLPNGDGLDLVREWREQGLAIPVLMLTALNQVDERIKGLKSGADDYLTKPFNFDELVARLEALSRRSSTIERTLQEIGPLRVFHEERYAELNGVRVELTAREFSLLSILAKHPGRIYSRQQLEDRLYGADQMPQSNTIDAAVYTLRKKLGEFLDGRIIHTRRGLGYALEWVPGAS
ncbi:MAG: response regulator transcription factor [Verrucomicrobiales bacterium]|nr:response regulator transcription factor [Verrucomicrobiales bacterium]